MNTRPAGGAVDVAHPGGDRGGMCGSDLAPPHTLQSTGQQQRPRGVQSWVSILVPALLHELGGLRQPPPRTASPSWLGGGVQWPHPGGSRGDAGMGGSWRPSLPSPGSRAPGRRGGGGRLWSCSWRVSLWPPGATSGGGREAKPEAGGDGSCPRDLEQMQLGEGVSHEPLGQAGGPWRG